MWNFVASKWARLNAASGMVSEGQGMAVGSDGGIGALLLAALIGAFFGLIVGLIVSHLFRFLSMTFNRNLGGHSWVIICVVLGGAIFAWLSVNSEKN